MAFETIETSRRRGRPVTLIFIRYGQAPSSYYAYTDAEQAITFDGVVYRPVPLQRGKIAVSGTMDKATLELRLSKTTEVATLFLGYPPSEVVNIIIRQGHANDGAKQFLVGWTGRVVSSKRTDTEVVLSCEPLMTSMKRVGLRRHYQYTCPHVLFGPQCRASKVAATVTKNVAGVTGSTIRLPAGWNESHAQVDFLGGMIEWTNPLGDVEYRTILRLVNETDLLLSGKLKNLFVSTPVKVIRGCGRTMDACRGHDNILNFGGCPFIPTENPIGSKNQFF